MNSTGTQPKIALYLPNLSGGGAERVMVNIAGGLVAEGAHVDMVLAQASGVFINDLPTGVHLVDLKGKLALKGTRDTMQPLARYLAAERPHAILSALDGANVTAMCANFMARSGTSAFVSLHNTPSVEWGGGGRRNAIYRLFMRWLYPLASGIIAVSQGVADDYCRLTGVSKDRVDVIYNPVITPDLRTKAEAPVDHPWLQPGQIPVILNVGRLSAQKDHANLIRAFAELRNRIPCRLLILGEGELRDDLEKLVAEVGIEGDIQMPGFVDNPFAYMNKAAMFVLSSRWEGLPTVLIEAISCGAPVISTDCPSGPREILRDGQYGRLVPVGDSTSLASSMYDVLTDRKNGLLSMPPEESWRRFERQVVCRRYLETLMRKHS